MSGPLLPGCGQLSCILVVQPPASKPELELRTVGDPAGLSLTAAPPPVRTLLLVACWAGPASWWSPVPRPHCMQTPRRIPVCKKLGCPISVFSRPDWILSLCGVIGFPVLISLWPTLWEPPN